MNVTMHNGVTIWYPDTPELTALRKLREEMHDRLDAWWRADPDMDAFNVSGVRKLYDETWRILRETDASIEKLQMALLVAAIEAHDKAKMGG